MKDLFRMKGRLEIVIGRGWISAWEASRLGAGAAVMSDTEAGESAELIFEGRWLARGEICIIGDEALWGLRISGLDREARRAPERERGEGLAEVLPFELVLPVGAAYSLEELGKASCGTIVSFDSVFEYPSPLVLRIAGVEAARGHAAVVGERHSILIDQVQAISGMPELEALSTGAVLAPPDSAEGSGEDRKAKLYDFRRPDQFTARAIKALFLIHERMLESLKARDPGFGKLRAVLVDQLTWGEWLSGLDDVAKRDWRLWRTTMGRPGRAYERQDLPLLTGLPLLQPSPALRPLSPELESHITRWAAGDEARLGDRACFIAAWGLAAGTGAGELVAAMKSAWKLVGDATFSQAEAMAEAPFLVHDFAAAAGLEGDPRGMLENELVALVRLEGEGGRLDLVYSARALYPVTKALEAYARFAPQA